MYIYYILTYAYIHIIDFCSVNNALGRKEKEGSIKGTAQQNKTLNF